MTDPTASFATPRVAAGALFRNIDGDVLLVHPTYKDTWDIPGGYVERGESPAAACRREVREELGLDLEPAELLAVDWAPSESEGDKLLFIFDLKTPETSNIQLDTRELDDWKWVLQEQLASFLIPRLCRRIESILENTSHGLLYLEHGKPRS